MKASKVEELNANSWRLTFILIPLIIISLPLVYDSLIELVNIKISISFFWDQNLQEPFKDNKILQQINKFKTLALLLQIFSIFKILKIYTRDS